MPDANVKKAFYQLRNSRLFLKDNFIFRLIGCGSKRKRALNFASRVIRQGNFKVSKYAMINRLIGLGLIKGLPYQKIILIITKETKMNRIKENSTKVNFIYFKLDIKSDIMYEIQGEGMINECDMAIIRTSSLPDVNNMQTNGRTG